MRRLGGQHGFSMVQGLFALLIAGSVSTVSMPRINQMLHQYKLMGVAKEVRTQIRGARMLAMTAGQTVRVRFDCPGTGQYRVVEVLHRRSVDNDLDRCSLRSFPYPDPDPGSGPDLDGPVLTLDQGVTFTAHQDFDIAPTGEITVVGGAMPVKITVTNGEQTHTLTVRASGSVDTDMLAATGRS